MLRAWITGVLGIWLIVASFVITGGKVNNLANDLIVGIIVAIASFSAFITKRIWLSLITGILATWLILSAFLFFSNQFLYARNNLIVGVIITILGFLVATGRGDQSPSSDF